MKKFNLFFLILLMGMETNAQLTFQKTIGGIESEGAHSIQLTFDDGYIIAGATSSFGVDSGDAYFVKTDANANILWSKTFGGSSTEVINEVKQTTDSGYIMVGMTKSSGPGNMNILVLKTDNTGILSWSKTYGGSIEQNGYS